MNSSYICFANPLLFPIHSVPFVQNSYTYRGCAPVSLSLGSCRTSAAASLSVELLLLFHRRNVKFHRRLMDKFLFQSKEEP